MNHRPMMFLAGLIALGCTDQSVATLAPASASTDRRPFEALAPLVLHRVPPVTTDPAINQFLDDHYVWLDTAAKSSHELFVFMSGTGQKPSQFLHLEQEAARLGYHVIGLSFVNSGALAKICPVSPDPAACYENIRLEIIDGIDRTALINVNRANSIDNRLTKLLEFLDTQHPGEGWGQFLGPQGPKWPLIAISGLSVGGGEAAMIAKTRLVARVVLFSAVPDSIGKQAAPWVATHVTPSNRYYGLAHTHDGFFVPITAAWDSLGLAAFGPPVAVEENEPPFGGSHRLLTSLPPIGGFVGLNAHASTATDAFTPLAADGTPLLREAWRYMLSALPRRNEDGRRGKSK